MQAIKFARVAVLHLVWGLICATGTAVGIPTAWAKDDSAGNSGQVGPSAEAESDARVLMDNARLGGLLKLLDPELSGQPGNWVITFQETSAQVLTDERADRMRIMIPIADAKELEADVLYRLLQANYESALDARYAIAQGLVWVAYIHPLSPLTEGELLLALAQTYNAASTFGGSYSGGLFQFGGGDNRSEVFDDILQRGTDL